MFSDDEAEEDAIVNQVLDEIGIEISGKVSAKYLLARSDLYRLLSVRPYLCLYVLYDC